MYHRNLWKWPSAALPAISMGLARERSQVADRAAGVDQRNIAFRAEEMAVIRLSSEYV